MSLALGVGLIALALPRIPLEADLLDIAPTLDRLEQGGLTAAEALPFAEGLEARATATRSPRVHALAARAWIALAGQAGLVAQPSAANDHALALQAAGLVLAPADQYGWQRLSHTLAVAHQWIPAAAAWDMAVRTGPFEPEIMAVKFQSGVALWPYMDLDQRAAFGALAATFLQTRPADMLALTRRFGAVPLVRQALAGQAAGPAFETALAKTVQPGTAVGTRP